MVPNLLCLSGGVWSSYMIYPMSIFNIALKCLIFVCVTTCLIPCIDGFYEHIHVIKYWEFLLYKISTLSSKIIWNPVEYGVGMNDNFVPQGSPWPSFWIVCHSYMHRVVHCIYHSRVPNLRWGRIVWLISSISPLYYFRHVFWIDLMLRTCPRKCLISYWACWIRSDPNQLSFFHGVHSLLIGQWVG